MHVSLCAFVYVKVRQQLIDMNKIHQYLRRLRWALIVSLLPVFNMGVQGQDLNNGLVALWSFDDKNFQDSVGEFHGEEMGTDPIEFTTGRPGFGQALALDGVDQYVQIVGGDASDLTFEGGSMSVSAWFRIGAFDKSWQALIAKGEGNRWRVHRRGGEPGLAHAGGVGEGSAGDPLDLDVWHHLVAVSDADTEEFGTRLYINGEIYSENASAPSLGENDKYVMIGGNPDTGNRTWNGDIDDIAIWDRVLSEAEVAAIFTGSSLGEPAADSDGDGMSDSWEESWGFDPNDPSDADQDADGDGDTNLVESQLGTDPTDTTDPFLVSMEGNCDMTTVTLTFSEALDEAVAGDAGNYSFEPALDITAVTVKKKTVTLTTATQAAGAHHALSINNLVDLSKNSIAANTSADLYTCVEVTEGALRFEAWFGIGGASIDGLQDERVPLPGTNGGDTPDLVSAVYSFNTRDAFPDDSNNDYAARMYGFITPEESGSYHFFTRSDDASELFLSTDDKPANAVWLTEELDCCDAFQEPGIDDTTTFEPISLVAGKRYYIEFRYKEGGGGDWGEVAWRKEGDDTPASALRPITGGFLSTSTPVLSPANGAFTARSPIGKNANPNASISVSHRSGVAEWTAENTSLAVDGVTVSADQVTFEDSGGIVTISHTPSAIFGSDSEHTVSLTYPDPGGNPATENWSFTARSYMGPTLDSVGSYPGFVFGKAVSTEDAGGHTGTAGDYGMDMTAGGSVAVLDAAFLNPVFKTDEVTVAYWLKKDSIANSSSVWINSPSSPSGQRGFQAHTPWGNGSIYFDTAGCCDAATQRINAPLSDFAADVDAFWADWHLWSFSKKGDLKEIRIDGELFFDGFNENPLPSDITSMWIGSNGSGGSNDKSVFDDFAVFSKALSESDLKAIAGGKSAGTVNNLVAFWDFNEAVSSIGNGSVVAINFGADEPDGNRSDVSGAAGVLGTSNWNNVDGSTGEASGLIVDNGGSAADSSISVDWASNNTWSSQGRGEENNEAPDGNDRNMMTGYLDTNNTSQTTVTVSGLPDGASYDVVVYAKGGMTGRGGEFSIGDSVITHSTESSFSGAYNYGSTGDYIVFKGVTGSSFTLIGTPTTGGAPRAPINGIEVVIGGGVDIPAASGSISGLSLQDGNVVIEYTGTLKSSESVTGPYSSVAGASSPYSVEPTKASEFYIAE